MNSYESNWGVLSHLHHLLRCTKYWYTTSNHLVGLHGLHLRPCAPSHCSICSAKCRGKRAPNRAP